MIPIDAYKFRREIDRFVDKYGHINMTITQFMTAVERSEVDAVPVIRCKDCKYYEMMKYTPFAYYCSQMDREGFYDSDFCSLAKRREDEPPIIPTEIIDSVLGEDE